MITENILGSEYINVPADNISRWCTSVFTWGAYTGQSKVSDMQSRNSKTKSFQNRRTEFGAKINLNEKKVRGGDASSYVNCAILNPPKQKNNINGL